MIYFTGDTHGETSRFRDFLNYGEANWTADDTLIICGDFGYLFKNDVRERLFLDELAARPYTICFCDGNHENFPAIYEYPVKEWNGGKVHEIRPNIFHLMRGQIFTIEGKKIFAMGGAYSRDKAMRTAGRSWWPEELPCDAEYKEAAANLKAHDFKVDYVVSHTAPTEIIRRVGWTPDIHDGELTGFLEWVMYETEYKKWFFGHLHLDEEIGEKHRALSFDVVAV
ncbi:MAG: metallophosphatase family protein [Clostridia bacterium]|nr:metallophosphatase family protein [Clostridia bacterium]